MAYRSLTFKLNLCDEFLLYVETKHFTLYRSVVLLVEPSINPWGFFYLYNK